MVNLKKIREKLRHLTLEWVPQFWLDTGIPDLNEVLGDRKLGIPFGRITEISGLESQGKAQPLDEPVLLASGVWKPMGDLKVGDELASWDGQPSKVTKVFPRGTLPIYRVTFSDGRSTRCCGEHLWEVIYLNEPRVKTTLELKTLVDSGKYRGDIHIPLVNGCFGEKKELPVDPWMLGYLLGNGGLISGSPTVTLPTPAMKSLFTKKVSQVPGLTINSYGNLGYRIVQKGPGRGPAWPNPLKTSLQHLGVWGKSCFEKFIPDLYLSADRESRLELLRGLLDSDGTINKTGQISFSTGSERLALGVQTLIRSLGGVSNYYPKPSSYSYKGEKLKGKPSFFVRISPGQDDELFYHPWKLKRAKEKLRTQKTPHLRVTSIEPVGELPCQCISTSHHRKLYITSDYICTHNTAIMMAIAAFAQMFGAFIIWIDFETSFTSKWAIQRGLAACPSCSGRGLIPKKVKGKADPILKGCEDCSGGGRCKVCSGTGTFKNESCPTCEGTGENKGSGMDESKFALIQPYVGQFYDDPKNPTKLCPPRLTCAEELCEEAELVMSEAHKDHDKIVTVVDSIASMLTRAEAAAGLDGNLRTSQELPKFMNRLLRRWVGLGQSYNMMVLLINQLRQNPMARFSDPWYTPGGNAPRFYSHVRVRVSRVKGSKIVDKQKLIGIKGVMKNKKNKVGGVEQSAVGYKIMFAGKIEFVKAKEVKADSNTTGDDEE